MIEKFVAVVVLFQSSSTVAPTLPKFSDFPVAEVYRGAPTAPVLRTRLARLYRTTIREAAKGGPNFAGHYTIALWGCGSDCWGMALVDQINGDVFGGPAEVVSAPPAPEHPGAPQSRGPMFQIDSRLLVIHGCPGEADCGLYYYEWTGARFKLLRKLPATERK